MAVHVALLSGKSVTINAGNTLAVKQLRVAAEAALGIGIEQLIVEGAELLWAWWRLLFFPRFQKIRLYPPGNDHISPAVNGTLEDDDFPAFPWSDMYPFPRG